MTDIKNVHFGFEGPSAVSTAVKTTAYHKPEEINEWIKRHYTLAAEGTQNVPAAELYIIMESEREDVIYIRALEYLDASAPDFDWNMPSKELVQFEINLTRAMGKDWQAYLELRKMKSGLDAGSGRKADDARQDMHNFIAEKLQVILRGKGLKDAWNDNDTETERQLLSLFSEYRGWMQNRQQAADYIMGRGPRGYF